MLATATRLTQRRLHAFGAIAGIQVIDGALAGTSQFTRLFSTSLWCKWSKTCARFIARTLRLPVLINALR